MNNWDELKRLAYEVTEGEVEWLDADEWRTVMAEDWADFVAACTPEAILALIAENEALRKDAERYRFLRSHGVLLKNHDFLSYGEIADFRIDAMSSGSIIPPDPVSELLKSLDRAHAGHMVGHDQSDQPKGGYSEGYIRGYGACIESARRILGIKP